jgi:hypothetical protein
MVLVAAAMFPIVFVTAFAIDVSHWFDYSRNLQNRADAAALAAGDAYGNICFNASPGDKWTGSQSVIGKYAQLYSGPGTQPPVTADMGANSAANVPYTDSSVFSATGSASYKNVPNLKGGALTKYYVRVNADDYADGSHGGTGTNFSIGDFCSADPALDKTDRNPGPAGALADVKVTQEQVPYFVPVLKLLPNISAHARVAIQELQSEKGVRPIGVRDADYTPCVWAYFLNNDGSPITDAGGNPIVAKLTSDGATPATWSSVGNPVNLPIPATNPVTVQIFLNNCSTTDLNGLKYDYYYVQGGQQHEQTFGLVYINNWGNPTAPTGNQPPVIWTGGVHLTGGTSTECDPYFETDRAGCSIGVDAQVRFQPDPGGTRQFFVQAVVDGTDYPLGNGGGTDWATGVGGISIAAGSGEHDVEIQWAQLGGQVGSNTCKTSGDPFAAGNKCNGTFGVQQRAFAGQDGSNFCGPINNDTGPLRWITVGQTGVGSAGVNAFGGGSTANGIYVTTKIVGLSNTPRTATAADDICLRVAESDSHTTGFVNCGQGFGTPNDILAIQNGCNPVQKNIRVLPDGSLKCPTAYPAIVPPDCVQNDTGQTPPVLQGFDKLIGNPSPTSCAPNLWNQTDSSGNPVDITIDDPRAVVMIITAPVDTTNGTHYIPIRDFAVFYVTGWSTGQGGVKGCPPGVNDPAPTGAGNGEIWGHWTSVAVPSGSGTSNGQNCDFTAFGNCIAVLTR